MSLIPSRVLAKKNVELQSKMVERIHSPSYEPLVYLPDGDIIATNFGTGHLYKINKKLNSVLTYNTLGLFSTLAKGIMLSTGTLIIYSGGKIYRSNDTTYATFTVVFTLRANTSILVNNGWSKANNDNIMFGEYSTNGDTANPATQKVYLGTNDGATWTEVQSFNRTGAGNIRHVHACCYDPYDNKFWVCTGDGSELENEQNAQSQLENRVYRVDVDGTNWDLIGTGSQYWRVVGMVFTPDYAMWGIDGWVFIDSIGGSVFCKVNKTSKQMQVVSGLMEGSIFGAYTIQTDTYGKLHFACEDAYNNAKIYMRVWVYNELLDKWTVAYSVTRSNNANVYAHFRNILGVGGDRVMLTGINIRHNEVNLTVATKSCDIKKMSVVIT